MTMNENEKMRMFRLLPGATVDDLIEELFAMAGDKQTQQFPYGIDLTPRDPDKPPLVYDFPDDGEDHSLMQINRGDGSFSLELNADNELQFSSGPVSGPGSGTGTSLGSNAFPGRVDAYLGSNQYTVTIYPRGTALGGTAVTVKQLEGDPAFPHQADGTRWALVVKAGDEYSMNMPIWG